MTSEFTERVRRLRNVVEPVAAGVYFAPEARTAYEALGFGGSHAVDKDGVARPELKSYFTSRGACMGKVPGEVVATAFGCFNPRVAVAAVDAGWQMVGREAILDARERGAVAMLQRVLGEKPEGLEQVTELLKRGARHPRYWFCRSDDNRVSIACGSIALPATPGACHITIDRRLFASTDVATDQDRTKRLDEPSEGTNRAPFKAAGGVPQVGNRLRPVVARVRLVAADNQGTNLRHSQRADLRARSGN